MTRFRRRRLTNAALVLLVLVLVSLCSWWYWPRGDARFVGKWEVHLGDDTHPFATMRLFTNGDGDITESGKVKSFPWRTIDGRLFLMGSQPELPEFAQYYYDVLKFQWEWPLFDPVTEWEIVNLSDKSCKLIQKNGWGRYTMTRIPE